MAAREILAATNNLAQSSGFEASNQQGTLPCTIMVVPNLAGVEVAGIEVTHDDGTTWTPLIIAGEVQQLDVNTNIKSIYGPGQYRVNKSATVGIISVQLLTNKRL